MARYNRTKGIFDIFVMLPWQASIAAGVLVSTGMYWVLPAWLSGHSYLAGLSPTFRTFAWFPAVLFTLIAILSYIRIPPKVARLPAPRVEHDWKDFANDPLFDETTTQTGAEWILTAGGMGKNSKGAKRFNTWSLDALRALEWKRFELVCARYYELVGFQPKTTGAGADGGIDIRLFKTDPAKPIAIVQCKAWNASDIGVKEIRELLGVMSSEKVSRGIFITTGCYTREARDFGEANPMQLLDGATFLSKISEMPPDQQDSLLKFAFDGDFSTPTCSSCGIKMVKRDSKHGPFWGCLNFPRCRSKFHIRQ